MGKKTVLPTIKIAVVGSSGVGKYSLSHQYAKGWIEPKDTNVSATANCPRKVVQHENGKFDVQVTVCKDLDCNQLSECDGIVLAFSISDKTSLTYAKTTAFKKLHEKLGIAEKNGINASQPDAKEIKQLNQIAETPTGSPTHAGLSVPVLLIGNKVDEATLNRQVDVEVGKSLSHDLSCIGYFETSAPCNTEVPTAFGCLVNEIIHRRSQSTGAIKTKTNNACCLIS